MTVGPPPVAVVDGSEESFAVVVELLADGAVPVACPLSEGADPPAEVELADESDAEDVLDVSALARPTPRPIAAKPRPPTNALVAAILLMVSRLFTGMAFSLSSRVE